MGVVGGVVGDVVGGVVGGVGGGMVEGVVGIVGEGFPYSPEQISNVLFRLHSLQNISSVLHRFSTQLSSHLISFSYSNIKSVKITI